VCPELGRARKNGAAWDELASRHDEIAERLKVNRPSTVWQRMHDDHGLQASLPSFRRYALATLPEAYGRRVSITVRRDDPPPGDEAQVDYGRLGKWTDPKTGETMILNAFILVLSFRGTCSLLSCGAWTPRRGWTATCGRSPSSALFPSELSSTILKAESCTRTCTIRCSTAATLSWPIILAA
jgi:hypothetical protein